MNKEKSFAKELAELINRHSIDAKFETADDILATVAIDALNAYAKAKQTQERRNNPDADTCDCPACLFRRAMEKAAQVTKDAQTNTPIRNKKFPNGIVEVVREMFPGAEISVGVPRRNPRDKRWGKNKRKGGRRNE